MKKYFVNGLVETQRSFMSVEEEFESDLEIHDFEKWLIGYFYLYMQSKNVNDRFVKIQRLEISSKHLDGDLSVKFRTTYKGKN